MSPKNRTSPKIPKVMIVRKTFRPGLFM